MGAKHRQQNDGLKELKLLRLQGGELKKMKKAYCVSGRQGFGNGPFDG
jgi:hypothetical protein